MKRGGAELPVYLSAENFKPFITSELATALTAPILYYTKSGAEAQGE